MKLSKAVIKKYGITKKAWSVMRGKKHKGVKHMAKKKHFSNKTKRMSVNKIVVAGLVYGGLVRPLIDKGVEMIGFKGKLGGYEDEIVGFGLGYAFKNQKGMIGDVANVAMAVEASSASYQIVSPMIQNITSGFGSGTNNIPGYE